MSALADGEYAQLGTVLLGDDKTPCGRCRTPTGLALELEAYDLDPDGVARGTLRIPLCPACVGGILAQADDGHVGAVLVPVPE